VQALFDAADGLVEQVHARGRKGGVAALRDAIVPKTVYAFGLSHIMTSFGNADRSVDDFESLDVLGARSSQSPRFPARVVGVAFWLRSPASGLA
jgi:hypothetical protein